MNHKYQVFNLDDPAIQNLEQDVSIPSAPLIPPPPPTAISPPVTGLNIPVIPKP
jgi:hypothetical protein